MPRHIRDAVDTLVFPKESTTAKSHGNLQLYGTVAWSLLLALDPGVARQLAAWVASRRVMGDEDQITPENVSDELRRLQAEAMAGESSGRAQGAANPRDDIAEQPEPGQRRSGEGNDDEPANLARKTSSHARGERNRQRRHGAA